MTIAELLANAQHAIQSSIQVSKYEAKLEAQILLQHLLNVNHAWLIAHDIDTADAQSQTIFNTLLQRRIKGEPIAYILGEREFYGLPLKVTHDTLIPRPDTETLVEAALAHMSINKLSRVLDLGTGSGAIALAIAKHRPQAQVTAVDASKRALQVAQENAEHLDITSITFVQSNWFDALQDQTFDVIVSNPPYIEDNDPHLNQGDLRFEPRSALASGEDGLDDIRHITHGAALHLNPKGWLLFEHGYNQAKSVSSLLASTHFLDISTLQDLGKNDRVTLGRST